MKAKFTFTVLSDITLMFNAAVHGGASLIVNNLPVLRINCASQSIEPQLQFFKRHQWESMNVIQSTEDICKEWKGNGAEGYRDNIATYATHVYAELETNDRTESVRTSGRPTVIENYVSGSILPTIILEVIDDLGQGPAIGVTNDTVQSTLSSPDGLFSGFLTIPLTEGIGRFVGISGFSSNGTRHLLIEFSEESLKPINISVEVRSCFVGESLALDSSVCVQCNAATYNFHPETANGCLPCPENGNYISSVIVPEKGHWHSFPCSEHIQRCLTDAACDFSDREEKLSDFEDVTSCDFRESAIAEYGDLLCKRVSTSKIERSCSIRSFRDTPDRCADCAKGLRQIEILRLQRMLRRIRELRPDSSVASDVDGTGCVYDERQPLVARRQTRGNARDVAGNGTRSRTFHRNDLLAQHSDDGNVGHGSSSQRKTSS